jgi:hypothetical protein
MRKRNRKKYILNNRKKGLKVSISLVLRKEIWVVATCGYVTSSLHFEHRYLLLSKSLKCSHSIEIEDASFY